MPVFPLAPSLPPSLSISRSLFLFFLPFFLFFPFRNTLSRVKQQFLREISPPRRPGRGVAFKAAGLFRIYFESVLILREGQGEGKEGGWGVNSDRVFRPVRAA